MMSVSTTSNITDGSGENIFKINVDGMLKREITDTARNVLERWDM